MVVDRAVLRRARILLRHPAHVVTHGGKRGRKHHHAIRRFELLLDRLQHLPALRVVGGAGQDRPALRVEEDPALGILAGTEDHAVVGDAAGKPFAIPQLAVHGVIELLGTLAERLRQLGLLPHVAHGGPQFQGVAGGHRQPAGNPLALVADHVHRVAPVALGDQAQAALVAHVQQPAHRGADALEHAQGAAVNAGDRLVQQRVVAGFIEVGLQADRQPHAMVGVRDLVDVFQLGAFDQQDAVGHGAAFLLLAQRMQESPARHRRADVAHAHVVLQIVAGLRVGAEPVDVGVVEHLARQPLVHEVVQGRVGRVDLDAATRLAHVIRVLALGIGKTRLAQILLAQCADFRVIEGRAENEAVLLRLVRRKTVAILQHRRRGLVAGVAAVQLLLLHAAGMVQAALALEGFLLRLPRVGRAFVQEEGLVLEVLLLEVIGHLLIRRDAAGHHAAQVGAVLRRLVHPRHVADRKVRVDAQLARAAGHVAHRERPQLHHVVHRQRYRHPDLDARADHTPRDVALARGKREAFRRGAHRLVRRREDLARIFVLDVEKAPRMMRVVRLLRLHERLRFEVRRMRVFGRLRLHELRHGITAAIHLHHHAPVPQEAGRARHRHRAVQFETFAIGAGVKHLKPLR